MKVEFKKIEAFSKKRVRFFTITLGSNTKTEFEYFLDKVDVISKTHDYELKVLFTAIEALQTKGAPRYLFVNEASADYMPVVSFDTKRENKVDFGVRLYCIRLRDDLVILMNGDIKTQRNPNDCPNVNLHFKRAIKIASKLDKALNNSEINYSDTNPFTDFELDI